jgi:hypothetical protein
LEAKFFDMVGKESNHKERIGKETRIQKKKVTKSVRGMPRLPEAKKDVISCEKLRGGANNL